MKKLWFMMLLAAMLVLTACSSDKNKETAASEKPSAKTEEKEAAENKEDAASVDKGLFNVEVTIPASMFEGENVDEVVAEAETEGIKATKNDDGSVTYKMSKAQHKEMLAEMKQSVTESIEDMKNGEDYVSIEDVTFNDNLSEFTMIVDKAAFENSMDGFATFALGVGGMMYQLYDGVNPEDNKVKIVIQDKETEEVFDEFVFPDDMNE
ncbi:hypothetical protein ACQCT5_00940 [Sutcliffiella halmapala]